MTTETTSTIGYRDAHVTAKGKQRDGSRDLWDAIENETDGHGYTVLDWGWASGQNGPGHWFANVRIYDHPPGMGIRILSREPADLDQAFYAASCFAHLSSSGDRTVTIMCARIGDQELYRVEDGRQPPRRDNETGIDWWPSHYIERAEDEDDVRRREHLERKNAGRRRR